MPEARCTKNRVAEVYRGIAPSCDIWGRLTESMARDRWYHGLGQKVYRLSPALLGGCRSHPISKRAAFSPSGANS